jgi:hypothetical protein
VSRPPLQHLTFARNRGLHALDLRDRLTLDGFRVLAESVECALVDRRSEAASVDGRWHIPGAEDPQARTAKGCSNPWQLACAVR